MPTTVTLEVAPGELLDKLTILEIKLDRIVDAEKRANVDVELDTVRAARDAAIAPSAALDRLTAELRAVNEALWNIEDDIRDCERRGDFGDAFIALARSVYKTNDRRADLKKAINHLLGSRLVEEKSYTAY